MKLSDRLMRDFLLHKRQALDYFRSRHQAESIDRFWARIHLVLARQCWVGIARAWQAGN